jgi:acetylornithine deacetylase/succinyl-diaminopimelate desuccinylase-like protein
LPNAIAFGMWFQGLPYPGHDVDERIGVADLHKGMEVLLEALNELAYSAPIAEALKPAGISPRR